jgi:hypothetical protein
VKQEEALLQSEQEARAQAEEEANRLAEARAQTEEEVRRLAEEARTEAENVTRLRAESEQRVREAAELLQAEQEARTRAEAEAERLVAARAQAEQETQLSHEVSQQPAEEASGRIEETRRMVNDEASRRAELEAHLQQEQEFSLREQLAQEQASELSYPVEADDKPAAIELSWDDVSLSHQDESIGEFPVVAEASDLHEAPVGDTEVHQPAKAIDVLMSEKGIVFAEDDAGIPSELLQRLSSPEAAEREAALGELVAIGGDDAFRCITRAFDDPSVEVRNAAAQALYALQPDRAASFTRALREGTPERRRKIGNALASSGLAANAVGSLSGESREKTYDAFSLLFLMSKAGEVKPLMQAIEDYPNVEVRIAVVKLLALSGQPEIVPAFRRLAVRGSLPSEVRSAVMEAIYQISSQARENASSAA